MSQLAGTEVLAESDKGRWRVIDGSVLRMGTEAAAFGRNTRKRSKTYPAWELQHSLLSPLGTVETTDTATKTQTAHRVGKTQSRQPSDQKQACIECYKCTCLLSWPPQATNRRLKRRHWVSRCRYKPPLVGTRYLHTLAAGFGVKEGRRFAARHETPTRHKGGEVQTRWIYNSIVVSARA